MEQQAVNLQALQEVESHFENAKRHFLKMAINQFLNGKISEKKFCKILKQGELAEIFLREYMGIKTDNPLFKAASKA